MLKEALEYLMSQSADGVKPIDLETDDPRSKTFVIGGNVTEVETPVPPRNHNVNSLEDFAKFVAECSPEDCVVFYDESVVVGILDNDGHRVERVAFVLSQSDQFDTIEALNGTSCWKNQKDFVRLLKIDLAGAIPPVDLLEVVRRVKFENGTTVKSEVGRARESLGREIRSQVETEREVPEGVVVWVPVYKSLGEREKFGVECSVEVDPLMGTFRLAPLPDEVERVQHLAMASIRRRLEESLPDGVPVFYGSP
jgi:hypothetical protein